MLADEGRRGALRERAIEKKKVRKCYIRTS